MLLDAGLGRSPNQSRLHLNELTALELKDCPIAGNERIPARGLNRACLTIQVHHFARDLHLNPRDTGTRNLMVPPRPFSQGPEYRPPTSQPAFLPSSRPLRYLSNGRTYSAPSEPRPHADASPKAHQVDPQQPLP